MNNTIISMKEKELRFLKFFHQQKYNVVDFNLIEELDWQRLTHEDLQQMDERSFWQQNKSIYALRNDFTDQLFRYYSNYPTHFKKVAYAGDIIRDNRVIKQVGIENYEPQFDNITQNFLDFQYFIQNVLHDDIQFIILGHYQLIDALLEKNHQTREVMEMIEERNLSGLIQTLTFNRRKDGIWEVKVKNRNSGDVETVLADYVFIGAGGGAIPLLQKTGIPESKHLGGFPISGQFLICTNPDVINEHDVKVYGKEPPGTPPMTVPHLDTRYIDGERTLLFGPFANIGPKFLRNGSNLDLFKSVKPYNITTLLASAVKNLPLIKYSIDQVLMTKEGCMNHLRTFYPEARDEDWQLYTAGKRVQVIKDTKEHGKGFIQFGTEVVNSKDHSVIALLGESPGASTSVSVALEVLEKNFAEYEKDWTPKLQKMIPSYGKSLIDDVKLMRATRKQTSKDLELNYYESK